MLVAILQGLPGDVARASSLSLTEYLYTAEGSQAALLPASQMTKFGIEDLTSDSKVAFWMQSKTGGGSKQAGEEPDRK